MFLPSGYVTYVITVNHEYLPAVTVNVNNCRKKQEYNKCTVYLLMSLSLVSTTIYIIRLITNAI